MDSRGRHCPGALHEATEIVGCDVAEWLQSEKVTRAEFEAPKLASAAGRRFQALGAARPALYDRPMAIEMTPERWRYTTDYLDQTFGSQDDHLAGLMRDAVARGLPDIAVSAPVGRLLMLLTSMTRGRLAIEVGTLGGYSAIWIARGLRAEGRLITIEPNELHADFALEQLAKAGVSGRVELRRGTGLDVLARLGSELEPGSVDVLFLDAVKTEYPDYFRLARPLVAPGGLVIVDNALGSGSWWIDHEGHAFREGAHRLNVMLAEDPEFEAVGLPIREGVVVARRAG